MTFIPNGHSNIIRSGDVSLDKVSDMFSSATFLSSLSCAPPLPERAIQGIGEAHFASRYLHAISSPTSVRSYNASPIEPGTARRPDAAITQRVVKPAVKIEVHQPTNDTETSPPPVVHRPSNPVAELLHKALVVEAAEQDTETEEQKQQVDDEQDTEADAPEMPVLKSRAPYAKRRPAISLAQRPAKITKTMM